MWTVRARFIGLLIFKGGAQVVVLHWTDEARIGDTSACAVNDVRTIDRKAVI